MTTGVKSTKKMIGKIKSAIGIVIFTGSAWALASAVISRLLRISSAKTRKVGAMLALGAAMAFAIIFTTMSVNIVERQRELATLRAAGVRHRTLAGLVGGENTIVAALGVVPGLILGVASAQVMLQTYSNDQFILNLSIKPLTLVLSAAAIMGVAIASQIPGLRALRRMNVAEVVRERAA